MGMVLLFWKVGKLLLMLACLTRSTLEYVRLHPDDTHPKTMTQKSLLDQVQVSICAFFWRKVLFLIGNPHQKAQDNTNMKLLTISNWFKRRQVKGQSPASLRRQRQQIATPLTPISRALFFVEMP